MFEPKSVQVKSSAIKVYRYLSQLLFLTVLGQWSFYGIFRCPFPVPFVNCSSCPVITCWGRISSLFWGFWLLLPLSAVLFGRAFCSWVCPGGTVNQLITAFSPLSNKFKKHLNSIAPYGMYLAVTLSLFLWLGMNNPRWAIPIRVGDFFQSVNLTFEHANIYWLTRTLSVLGLSLLGLAGARIWCRWACPTGGAMEIFSRFSLFKVFKTRDCNECDYCRKICDMKTRPQENNCTNCGDCVDHCPQVAIKIGRPVNSD